MAQSINSTEQCLRWAAHGSDPPRSRRRPEGMRIQRANEVKLGKRSAMVTTFIDREHHSPTAYHLTLYTDPTVYQCGSTVQYGTVY
jgi:hypothetical protein